MVNSSNALTPTYSYQSQLELKEKLQILAYNSPAYYGYYISWSKVTKSMIGKNQCVYGDVYKTRNVGESTFQILFSENQHLSF